MLCGVVLWTIWGEQIVDACDKPFLAIESSACIGTYCNLTTVWRLKTLREPFYADICLTETLGHLVQEDALSVDESVFLLVAYGEAEIAQQKFESHANTIYLMNEQGQLEELFRYWERNKAPEGYLFFDYQAAIYAQLNRLVQVKQRYPVYRYLYEGTWLIKLGAYYVTITEPGCKILNTPQYRWVMKVHTTDHNIQGWIESDKLTQPF